MADLIILRANNSRCHAYVGDILTFTALIPAGAKVIFAATNRARFACRAANIDLTAHLDGFDAALATGDLPPVITLICEPKQPAPDPGAGAKVPGLDSIVARIVAAIFATFAAKTNDWVRANVSTQHSNWPPISNFARVIRNAIVHGGTVNINSEEAPTVEWRGIILNHKNLGEQIINTGRISLGDLILLMVELDSELDDLDAPLGI